MNSVRWNQGPKFNPANIALTGGTAAFSDGTGALPSITFAANPDTGFSNYDTTNNTIGINTAGAVRQALSAGNGTGTIAGFTQQQNYGLGWVNSTNLSAGTVDAAIARAGANSIIYTGGTTIAAGAATSRTQLNKAVTGIANAVATDVLTVTIPNAAHSATLRVKINGSLGAGGAIGANEATATNTYDIVLTRTAGVATVAAISAAYGAGAVAVAGAATVTAAATITAMSGAVGATQTFTVQVTISRSGGSSTNHTCLVYAELMNANATGVTIA